MTQSTIDSELEEIIELGWLGYEHSECDDSCPEVQNYYAAKEAIKNLIAQEANKAVAKELKNLLVIPGKYIDDGTMVYWSDFNASTLEQIIKDRLAQLTAEKEQADG